MNSIRPKQNSGFILVTTIWFLLIILLAASTFALWTNRSMNAIMEQSDATKAIVDIHSTKATLLYLMATKPMNTAGLVTKQIKSGISKIVMDMGDVSEPISGDEIFVDGRPYRGMGLARFSLQDEAGFININSRNPAMLKKLLEKEGVPTKTIDALIDKISDYTDKDDFHRLQGAEVYHYEQKNMLPPTNKPFNNELELYNVMDWKEVLDKSPNLIKNLSVNSYALINFNAANATIIGLLQENLQQEDVELILAERNERPFASMMEATQRTGLPLMQLLESVGTTSARTLRISLWYDGAKTQQQTTIKLMPSSIEGKPWDFKSSTDRPIASEKIESPLTRIMSLESMFYPD